MKRKHKKYSRPKKPFDKKRIDEEAEIKKEFGLKNKREIWKAEAKIKLIRRRAKDLIFSKEEQKSFFEKLKKQGFEVSSISDVLALEKKDYLKRRLQTIVLNKKIASTPKTARQFITHKRILVDGRVVDSPSYIVPTGSENKISLKLHKVKNLAGKNKLAENE